MAEFIPASSTKDYETAAFLFNEYAQWLNIDLGFIHFDQEIG